MHTGSIKGVSYTSAMILAAGIAAALVCGLIVARRVAAKRKNGARTTLGSKESDPLPSGGTWFDMLGRGATTMRKKKSAAVNTNTIDDPFFQTKEKLAQAGDSTLSDADF